MIALLTASASLLAADMPLVAVCSVAGELREGSNGFTPFETPKHFALLIKPTPKGEIYSVQSVYDPTALLGGQPIRFIGRRPNTDRFTGPVGASQSKGMQIVSVEPSEDGASFVFSLSHSDEGDKRWFSVGGCSMKATTIDVDQFQMEVSGIGTAK